MKILYFAWVKQKTGLGGEEISLPDDVTTVAGLVDWLSGRGENFAAAFEYPQAIRAAVNQEHKSFEAAISNSDEVAFFPPVTGG